jgi:hypothetical protein
MSQLSGSVFAGEDMRRDEEVKGDEGLLAQIRMLFYKDSAFTE